MKRNLILTLFALAIACLMIGAATGCSDCDGNGFPDAIGPCGLVEPFDVLM